MLTSLTVCVNYSDLLRFTLPRLKTQVDNCVVVTSFDDRATYRFARDNGATVVVTNSFYADGASFNKAAALEEAVDSIEDSGWDDWILHIDADVLVPDDMRTRLPALLLPSRMYGAKRLMAYTPEDFASGNLVDAKDQEMAGWFQLFFCRSLPRPWYDTSWKHAGGYDSEFWTRFRDREWLPFNVIHLGRDGQNWHGRQTDFWGDLEMVGPLTQAEIADRREKWLESKKHKRALDAKE